VKVFFDFDGTLVEIMQRDYAIYCDSLPAGSRLDFHLYTRLRRKKTNIEDILSLTHRDYLDFRDDFLAKRESMMEMRKYLSLDTLLSGAHEVLSVVSKKHECYILSARQNENLLKWQCDSLDISRYFCSIIAVSSPVKKGRMISDIRGRDESIMIGDTEKDIIAARESSSISVAVDTGIRDKDTLRSYDPDHIIVNLSNLIDIIDHAK
jgi:phosphoglycolate phosphatase-like HAD superfamily hydrolase